MVPRDLGSATHVAHGDGTFDEHAPARRGAARRGSATAGRCSSTDVEPARRDRLVLAADEPGPGDPRGARRGRHPRRSPGARATGASTTSSSASSRPSSSPSGTRSAEQRRHRLLSRYRAHGLLGQRRASGAVARDGARRCRQRSRRVDGRPTSSSTRATLVAVAVEGLKGERFVLGSEAADRSTAAASRSARRRRRPGRRRSRVRRPAASRSSPRSIRSSGTATSCAGCTTSTTSGRSTSRERKRRWGYYVLPILFGDRLVGRIEPRIDRKAGTLRVARPVVGGRLRPARATPASSTAFADGARSPIGGSAGMSRVVLPADGPPSRPSRPGAASSAATGAESRQADGGPVRRCPDSTLRGGPHMADSPHASSTWSGDLLTGSGMINYVSSGASPACPSRGPPGPRRHDGKTEPRGAPGGRPRGLLLDGVLGPPRQERHAADAARRHAPR